MSESTRRLEAGKKMDQVFGALGILSVVISATLTARRDLRAFPVSLVGHTLWFANGYLMNNYALMCLNVFLTCMTIYTWRVFSKYRKWK